MQERLDDGDRTHHHYYSCCWPAGRAGGVFWGVTLLILGLCWLLTELGFLDRNWWSVLGPALLLVWGAGILIWTARPGTAGGGAWRAPSRR